MAVKLEDRIFFDSGITIENAMKMRRKGMQAENAFIRDAYIGRWPNPGFRRESPFGLNVTVDFENYGTASVTYTDAAQIQEFMAAFMTERAEWLAGRRVTAYTTNNGMRLAGLSMRWGE